MAEYRSSEAVKTWMHGSERRFDTFTIAEYGIWDEAQPEESELESTLKTQGLEAAMNQAERIAVAGGYLDPHRADGRVFFEDDAPPDPFTTERTRAMERDMQHDENQRDAEYSIDAIAANGSSHLDVTKAWGEDQYARLIISQPDWETARANAETAHDLLDKDNLQGAMTLVELAGIEAGIIDPQRDDPRLFTEGPPDPFTTIRERELAQTVDVAEVTLKPEAADYPTMYRDFVAEAAREREANAALEGAAWFEATFEKSDIELLQPVNDTVNYAVVVQGTDPWTRELMVEKYWKEPGGYLGLQSVTLDTWDSDDEKGREQAEQAREALLEVHDERGLEALMHKAELTAMQNDWLDGDRADQRLFTQGPPDRFETLAQQLEGEINPYWHIDDEQIDDPEPPAHYWQMQHRPAQTPDGQPLGVALFVTEFPELPPDFDAYVEQHGMDDSLYPSQARTLEVAHFSDAVEARKFEAEFRGYLIPGLLDGPELAPEVAKLEGLSGEWQDLTQRDIIESMEPNRAVVRDPSDWHPYNPNAERDARIAAEGVYSDPIQQAFKRDETEIVSDTPELDF